MFNKYSVYKFIVSVIGYSFNITFINKLLMNKFPIKRTLNHFNLGEMI
jgi:hypothetical protein